MLNIIVNNRPMQVKYACKYRTKVFGYPITYMVASVIDGGKEYHVKISLPELGCKCTCPKSKKGICVHVKLIVELRDYIGNEETGLQERCFPSSAISHDEERE